jgi:hypothetical protein
LRDNALSLGGIRVFLTERATPIKKISVFITHPEKGKYSGQHQRIALDLNNIAGWLFGIDPTRVKSAF